MLNPLLFLRMFTNLFAEIAPNGFGQRVYGLARARLYTEFGYRSVSTWVSAFGIKLSLRRVAQFCSQAPPGIEIGIRIDLIIHLYFLIMID